MPSKSPQQHRFMEAAAHNPEFAKRAGIPQNVAKEFVAVRSYGTPNRDPLLSSANAYGHKGCGKERSVSHERGVWILHFAIEWTPRCIHHLLAWRGFCRSRLVARLSGNSTFVRTGRTLP